MPALAAVVVGILLGAACGGSVSRLGLLKLRLEWLVLPLFVLQAVARGRLLGMVGASRFSLAAWVVVSVVLVGAVLLNSGTPGMLLAAAGILMNLNVVVLNAAMPVVLSGKAADASAAEAAVSSGGFYRVAEQGDLLPWLGDTIPIAWGSGLLLLSPGDVVLMVAIAVVITHGMTMSAEDGEATPARA